MSTDSSSYLGIWHGSTSYQGYDFNNQPTGLVGYIDWAVYAPGNVPAGLTGIAGWTPTPGEFVYAYQAYETGSAPMTAVAVDLQNPADNIGTFLAAGLTGSLSTSSYINPFDSANWTFAGIGAGGMTVGLVFSSPDLPMLDQATTIDDSTGFAIPVPSPSAMHIPEPGTLTLASLGIFVFGGLRWLRCRRTVLADVKA
ncbi:MAG TPA: hypothetical protein VHV08_17010 [Pirellulales bacterium]|nr:hypothetical protein [Pirellulales bacterium]